MKKKELYKLTGEIGKILNEKKPIALTQIRRLIELCGEEFVQTILKETLEIEANGGLMTLDESRRRTPGGVFLFLARQKAPPEISHQIFTFGKRAKKKKTAEEAGAEQAGQDGDKQAEQPANNKQADAKPKQQEKPKQPAQAAKPEQPKAEKAKPAPKPAKPKKPNPHLDLLAETAEPEVPPAPRRSTAGLPPEIANAVNQLELAAQTLRQRIADLKRLPAGQQTSLGFVEKQLANTESRIDALFKQAANT